MMKSERDQTTGVGASHRQRDRVGRDDAGWAGEARADGRARYGSAGVLTAGRDEEAGPAGYQPRHTQEPGPEPPVARRTATGWRVGDEEVSDLTSAMVLADLLAADLPAQRSATPGSSAAPGRADRSRAEQPDARQLQQTVTQLEHALTVRVRVEQAIGVLAERHRLRPRQAFELLRSAARSRGRRVLEVASEVVDSATNPLLRIPEELARPQVVRQRGRMSRLPARDAR